jgi:hypothetical protein
VINFNHVSAFNECINKWGLIELVDPARSYTWSNNPRGAVRDPRASTTYVSNVDGGPPWEALSKTQERPPPMSETSMVGPLGSIVRDSGVPTTYVEDVDSGAPGRRCRRPRSAHHLCQRLRWRAPREALSETRERPPSMSETSMGGLGGVVGDSRAPTTYVRDVDGGPLGGDVRDPRAATTYIRDVDGGPHGKRCQRAVSSHHLCQRRR